MSSEEFEDLKKEGAFIRGAAVVTGKVWRGDYVGYFLMVLIWTIRKQSRKSVTPVDP